MDLRILLLALLIGLSGFFSGSETSLFSLSKLKLESIRKKHPKRGKIISYLLQNPQNLLITILICNLFVNIFATLIALKIFPKWIAFIVITCLILIFGEVTPKAVALKAAHHISLVVAPVFYFLLRVLYPLVFVIRKISGALVDLNSHLFHKNSMEPTFFNTDEMQEIIKSSQDGGILTKEEGNILGNLLEFEKSDLSKIVRPRNEIFSIPITIKLTEIIKLIKEKKYSRIPVWEDVEDNFIGVLHIKDLLKLNFNGDSLTDHRKLLRKPFFVPDSLKPEKLLVRFQSTRNRMAIIINEYGDIAGLLTLEDLLEEIIGEVVDKDDIKPLYHQYNASVISIEARMELGEFNEVFKTNLRDDEAVTVGGYILENIRRIPEVGETIELNNLKFKITGAKPNKIENMLVTKIQKRKKQKKNFLEKVI